MDKAAKVVILDKTNQVEDIKTQRDEMKTGFNAFKSAMSILSGDPDKAYNFFKGLSGDADANHDRVITAGELSAYVRREFAEEARDVGSVNSAGEQNYQFPVVDRGGVDIDQPVLALR